jgi:hypothetical protein
MSKFKQYIREFQSEVDHTSTRLKSIDGNETVQILTKKCNNALDQFNKGLYIQRFSATGKQTELGFLDASKMPPRLSRNTLNYYTLMINDDPTWKKFPRRQVICTLKHGKPSFDSPSEFIIFPYDSTKIGLCSKDDMWDSFARLKSADINARRYNDFIRALLNLGEIKVPSYDNNLGMFKNACKNFDKDINQIGGIKTIQRRLIDKGFSRTVQTLNGYNGDLYKLILHYYNPYGFKLVKPRTLKGNHYAELWFEGPALFINSAVLDLYLDSEGG